jgi:formyl-CoA transferase
MLEKVAKSSPAAGRAYAKDGEGDGALKGVRVVDLTQFEAGTSCTLMLAWMGAEVIKIEEPTKGEQGRGGKGESTTYFSLLNANKKSVTCNLKSEKGKEVLVRLIRTADIFMENFAPGVIERLGFGYDDVQKINPRIIYAQVKGFPPGTEYERYLCFDNIAQAMGGIMSVNGFEGRRPVRAGVTLGDTGTGLHATIGILAALHQRERTGVGQRVQVSMWEAMTNFLRMSYGAQAQTGHAMTRKGNASTLKATAPSESYPCKGGGPNDYCFIYSTRARDHQWQKLLTVIGREDLKDDPRFASPVLRYENRDAVDAIISEWTRKFDKWEVMRRVQEGGMPAGAILDTMELSSHPELRARGQFTTMVDPTQGEFEMVGCPIHMSDSRIPLAPAPRLGEHNLEIYGALGLGEDEYKELRAEKAI